MNVSKLLAAAGAVFALSAGAALAAEGCECCKDMAADAEMKCCDETPSAQEEPAPPSQPATGSASTSAPETVPHS